MFYTKYRRPDTRYQIFTQPSLAVPDQTIPIKTMVQRYAKGMPFNVPNLKGIYTDDEPAVDFNKLDLVEQDELFTSVLSEHKEIRDTIRREQQEKLAEARKTAENNEALKKELEQLKAQQQH